MSVSVVINGRQAERIDFATRPHLSGSRSTTEPWRRRGGLIAAWQSVATRGRQLTNKQMPGAKSSVSKVNHRRADTSQGTNTELSQFALYAMYGDEGECPSVTSAVRRATFATRRPVPNLPVLASHYTVHPSLSLVCRRTPNS